MRTDFLFWFHLSFIVFFYSIPFWPIPYLEYGVYAPLALATIWILFNGCPLTNIDIRLNDEYFSQILLKPFVPNISRESTSRFTYYMLLLVTVLGMMRLRRQDTKKEFVSA